MRKFSLFIVTKSSAVAFLSIPTPRLDFVCPRVVVNPVDNGIVLVLTCMP
jgi:hypothetical protein